MPASHDDFPLPVDSAHALLGNEAQGTPPSLEVVSKAIVGIMDSRSEYFGDFDLTSPSESRQDRILREIKAAQHAIEDVQPTRQHIKINLFNGQQTRDASNAKESDNAKIVEDLYATMNQVAGRGMKGYHDILTDAKVAQKAGSVVQVDSPYRTLMDLPIVALTSPRDNTQLCGVQLKLASSLFATFALENPTDDSQPHEANVYLTVITGRPASLSTRQ